MYRNKLLSLFVPSLKSHGATGLFLLLLFFQTALNAQVPQCSMLEVPLNAEADVSVNTSLQWSAVANATRYFLNLGTSPGGTELLDKVDMGSSLNYLPPTSLLPNTTYYVTVIPNNNSGDAMNCTEEQFTTGMGGGLPGCVTLLSPESGATGVAPDTDISWIAQSEAAGYFLTMGTTSGATDILDNLEMGNVTTYNLPADLPFLQRIYITINPYNSAGEVANCTELTFRTRGDSPPVCTEILDPVDGSLFVSVTSNITWIRDFNASGYRMTIEEKSIGGVRILDNVEVGNGTNFKPPNFMGNTMYFVTITPYNDLGAAQNCTTISFTTGDAPAAPECTSLLSPVNGATGVNVSTGLEWNAVSDAGGYFLSVGTASGLADLVANEDVGNTTQFEFTSNLPEGSTIFVTIIPYNSWGAAEGCQQQSFKIAGPVFVAQDLPIPKFFTPNNDGFNDEWIVSSTPELQINRIWIFNRFGQLLKQLAIEQGWDGSFNGRPLASDSYWYRIETTSGNQITGFVLLKR